MRNYSSFTFLVSLVFFCNKPYELHAQLSPKQDISGFVIDATTDKPLEAANVFLANTMLGDASNKMGYFIIRGAPSGTFELVVSVIGYKVQKRQLRITGPTKPLTIKLIPKPLQAPQIEVSATDMKEWRKKFKKFKKLFLGATQNASECKILNPYVLDFTKLHGSFKATADEPIVIENRALGYKLHYVLEEFEDSSKFLKIKGIPKFEELAPKTPEEGNRWQTSRLRAYLGSLRHFLATICKNYDAPIEDSHILKEIAAVNKKKMLRTSRTTIIKSDFKLKERDYLYKMARVIYEGFNVFLFEENPSRHIKKEVIGKFVNTNLFLSAGELPNERWLSFPGYLHVTYTKELEEDNYPDYLYEYRAPSDQQSFFKLNTTTILIDTSGHFYNRYGLTVYGYWAWERIADLLPHEYRMEQNPMN